MLVPKSNYLISLLVSCALLSHMQAFAGVSDIATKTAQYAQSTYQDQMLESLRQLMTFNTVAVEGVSSPDNPEHQKFKAELAKQAKHLGLDYIDYGYVVVIGLGDNEQRVGMITHGDIQPFNPTKWAQSPLTLDLTSEPGKLIGRGTEDDKGPISNALYAMKAIKDSNVKLNKRIELYVYMAEESDWEPLRQHIKLHSLPQVNITLDSEYPVVTAEKGYGTISMTFPKANYTSNKVYINEFTGGFFGSQIPEDAHVSIENANHKLLAEIKQRAQSHIGMSYNYQWQGKRLSISALGKSAHSSKPEYGVNAITHLADLLAVNHWPNNASGALINFINDHLGIGLYGSKFGDIAYSDDFMGPMSVQPTVLKATSKGMELNINIRRPVGKSTKQLEREISSTLTKWQQQNQITLVDVSNEINEPFVQKSAPQIDTLLDVFSFYTNITDAKPISIGGGTNSRLFPNAVSFGPSMPGTVYTGHSEHEYITMEQFVLTLKMYTAVLIELAK
ncbi:dipeptidase [Colwellia psychrerythraea]|uniref:Putative dipeptidase n=1 Tax=Colwellia psychrerythraea (strain 34H / ATCC BAA-681) TaxID=167879 RepID=Q486A9_COLP3|nr:dipeptidase [Colwellia psychrerythraea]AAZ26266.1 putative dipeptidase [Colwellia psychrerythraea 34H]